MIFLTNRLKGASLNDAFHNAQGYLVPVLRSGQDNHTDLFWTISEFVKEGMSIRWFSKNGGRHENG